MPKSALGYCLETTSSSAPASGPAGRAEQAALDEMAQRSPSDRSVRRSGRSCDGPRWYRRPERRRAPRRARGRRKQAHPPRRRRGVRLRNRLARIDQQRAGRRPKACVSDRRPIARLRVLRHRAIICPDEFLSQCPARHLTPDRAVAAWSPGARRRNTSSPTGTWCCVSAPRTQQRGRFRIMQRFQRITESPPSADRAADRAAKVLRPARALARLARGAWQPTPPARDGGPSSSSCAGAGARR